MIYKRCPLCHRRIPTGTNCGCYEQRRKAHGALPEINSFYNTELWRICKEKAKRKTFGLDPISLLCECRLEYGQTVHHILPLEECPERKADISNLIYITESHHRAIHEAYKTNQKSTIFQINKILEYFEQLVNGNEGGTLEILNKDLTTPLPSFLSTKF